MNALAPVRIGDKFAADSRATPSERSRPAGICSAIGGTPLVELARVLQPRSFRLFAKLEGLNPGGSAKDRATWNMVRSGLEAGRLKAGDLVIESSSGNAAVGLAQACAYFGLRLLCVTDYRTPSQLLRILTAYGTDIEMVVVADPDLDSLLATRLRRVEQLLAKHPGSHWLNQYANPENSSAYWEMAAELVHALEGRFDYLFCGISTCGTLRGCSEYLREQELDVKIIAVDAQGSAIYGDPTRPRLLSGHGAGVVPALFEPGLADDHVLVSDLDCVVGCRQLLRQEAIMAGGSSGGVLAAVARYAKQISAGANVVAIFPDRGERYLETIFSDEWTQAHFGAAAAWPSDERGKKPILP